MPLDVQPLSRSRRVLMLFVLLALFAGSLGLAQGLVLRRTAEDSAARVMVNWNFPAELNRTVPAIAKLPHVVLCRGAIIKGRPRWAAGMMQRTSVSSHDDALTVAEEMFGTVLNVNRVLEGPARFAGRKGIELEAQAENGEFGILRMVIVGGQAVAICYSGPGEITDGDKLYFDGLCARVSIREQMPRTGK